MTPAQFASVVREVTIGADLTEGQVAAIVHAAAHLPADALIVHARALEAAAGRMPVSRNLLAAHRSAVTAEAWKDAAQMARRAAAGARMAAQALPSGDSLPGSPAGAQALAQPRIPLEAA